MSVPVVWQNRIVGYDPAVPLDQLLAHPQNPKIHPTEQTEAVKAIIARLGWLDTVKVNVRTQHVLDGHDRIKAAMQAGQTTAPVDYVDVPEEDEFLVLGSFDFVGAMAVRDDAIYSAQLAALEAEDAALLAGLFRDDELAVLLPPDEPEPGNGGDEFPVDPNPEQTRVQPGDVWRVGDHLLACLDSTDRAAVQQILGTLTPGFVWADPPYGKKVVKAAMVGARFKDSLATKGKYVPIVGDDTTQTAIDAFLVSVDLAPKACHVWWGANYYAFALPGSSCWLIWDKRADSGIENTFADCELAWTSMDSPARVYRQLWNGMIREGEHDKRLHPTQKPLALAEWAFTNYGKSGDVILDPFLGSGISLIAAHRLGDGRRVVGFELSPAYVDVCLSRFTAETGIEPVRITAKVDTL